MNDNIEPHIDFLLKVAGEAEKHEDRQEYIKIAKILLELSAKERFQQYYPITINSPKQNDYQMPNYTQPILTCHNEYCNYNKKEGLTC